MEYDLKLIISPEAMEDLMAHKRAGNRALLKKLSQLMNELEEHPETGTGQIEKLKHHRDETWSRRLNSQHRLCYRIKGEEVHVVSVWGHYGDK